MNELSFHIGKQIRDSRDEAGISQEVFAEYLSLSRASMANIEVGRQNISHKALYKAACLLNKPISYFYPKVIPVEYNIQLEEVEIIKVKKFGKIIIKDAPQRQADK